MSEHQLSQISIKSAIKIFTFLDCFLEEEGLNPQYFKDSIEKFTFQERYFLYSYASEYFSDSYDSFLNKWINNIASNNGIDVTVDYLTQINNNAKSLRKIINDQKLKIVEKEFLNLKQTIDDENRYIFEKAIFIFDNDDGNFRTFQRIPLYVSSEHRANFKKFFFEALKDSLDSDSIEKLYYNTFEFNGNISELKLLYLRVDQKSLLDQAFKIITIKYKEDILERMKAKYIEEINSKIEERLTNATADRKKFIPKKIKYTIVTRLHFMKAFYNAFPHIRNAYEKALIINPSQSLDHFLTIRIKNFKNA